MARAHAATYPTYDPAAAVGAYIDEFGAIAFAGWVLFGVGLAIVASRLPVTAAAPDQLAASAESAARPTMIATRPTA